MKTKERFKHYLSLAIVLCFMITSSISIKADYSSRFDQMLYRLFNSNLSQIVVEKDGFDITDQFICENYILYTNNDLAKIKEKIAQNSIVFSEPSTINQRAIVSSTYTTNSLYALVTGTSPINPSVPIFLEIIFKIRITSSYDFNTGLIIGSPRTPTIIIEDCGTADSATANSIQHNGYITNGGYSVAYSNISFIVSAYGSLDGLGVTQTYNRFSYNSLIVFSPGS
ncbi:MAG: hypothetical protein PHP11_02420 [Erysipelotrichaceae bacterium]|nr:hypothetical protein [Erysipelotrichaceae bacterium]MDD3923937.1 hypothetical protein [Erysipelotrichaceae bacterium]